MKFKTNRILPEEIESFILEETYINAGDAAITTASRKAAESLGCLTICVLVLENGFTVTGESACASPENFSEETGRRIARENAVEKIWALLGFMLRDRLHMAQLAASPSKTGMATYVGEKVVHARPMDRGSYCRMRGWDIPEDENSNDEGYLLEYADGGEPNCFDLGFAGYVSWSPRDVFEKAYGPVKAP